MPRLPCLLLVGIVTIPGPTHSSALNVADIGPGIQWTHPLDAPRQLPTRPSRRFGAHRDGERPVECGLGHCGIDIGASRGQTVRAAAAGRVDRFSHHEIGRSGKFMVLQHKGGIETTYVHLDRIAPGINIGDRVVAGDAIGTLGRTGIRKSDPHLHFEVSVLERGHRRYVDPLPILRSARLIQRNLVSDAGLQGPALVAGEVRDRNGERIAGASVSWRGGETVTRAGGGFTLAIDDFGEIELTAEKDGMQGILRLGVAPGDVVSTLQINIR